jgi:hypothetical protein
MSADALQPWRHRSWIFPRDPQFGEKASRVLDLYAKTWDGTALRPDEFVVSADEKPNLQARRRKHPTLAPGPTRPMRVEHEYFRTGALKYLAAWDVHRAKLFGRCESKTTIGAVDRLVEQVMTVEPYCSARRVFWITDNCSSHRGEKAAARLRAKWPTVTLVHTPNHASWLNQVEIYFSIVQRKVVTPNTSRRCANSKIGCSLSRDGTSRWQNRFNGRSPAVTSAPCSPSSKPRSCVVSHEHENTSP